MDKFLKPFITLYYDGHKTDFAKWDNLFELLTSGPQSRSDEGTFNSHPTSVLRSLALLLKMEN